MEQISSLLAAAAVGGFAITAVAGKFMIPALHRLHFGQTIREEGPTWHSKKNGTPTFICESAGTQAEDAGTMKRMYLTAKGGQS